VFIDLITSLLGLALKYAPLLALVVPAIISGLLYWRHQHVQEIRKAKEYFWEGRQAFNQGLITIEDTFLHAEDKRRDEWFYEASVMLGKAILGLPRKERADAYLWLGYVYDEQGRVESGWYRGSGQQVNDALGAYSAAIQLNHKLAEAYYRRGRDYERLGRYQDAIKDYELCLKWQPTHLYTRNDLRDCKRKLTESSAGGKGTDGAREEINDR